MAGYTAKFLRINLSTGAMKAEIVPDEVLKDFIGGRGFGVHYLYRELVPGIDPLLVKTTN